MFVQFVNIKTQFCSSTLFKDKNFQCIKAGMEQKEISHPTKREECFRNQNSLLPVFLLQHKYHKSAHSQEERGETLSSDLLMVRHDGKEAAATAWEICSGKSASQLCPSNHQTSMWLIIWWGSCNHQASFSFLFWDCVVEPFPLAATGSFLRGWNKNAACPSCVLHVQSLTHFYQGKWSYFIWKEGREVRRLVWVWRKGNAASFSWAAGALALAWPAGSASAHRLLFPLGPAMKTSVWGLFSPPCGKFSGKYNWYLPPKLFQSVTKYLCGYFVQGTKCLYLIKSLKTAW